MIFNRRLVFSLFLLGLIPNMVAGTTMSQSGSSDISISFPWNKKKKAKLAEQKSAAENDSTKSGKNYEKIIGGSTKTTAGLFKVHNNKNDFYFEIPLKLLNRDMLVVNKLQKVQAELNDAGVNKGINYEHKMVRFELDKSQNKLMVRNMTPLPAYPENDAIGRSVRENFISPLIAGFKIESYNADSSAIVIKVNDIYNGSETSINNVFDNISLRTSAIKNLSKIVSAKPFKDNVVVTSELTTKVTEGSNTIFVTVEVSSSLILLSEKPMTPRYTNSRVGYFSVPQLYFSDIQQKMENNDLITRWRLEPREEDKAAYLRGELVEPIKPIVFYIDQSTPKQWREYMKKGVEDWQVAFEKAGFKNAIIAKELNDSINDYADDINYSIINYIASPKVNAMGPSIMDPRSGEILEADIIWWHNVITMLQKWITVQTGTVNSAVQSVIIPDSIMGDAMRFVACHEVGHSLGLRHNMMGSWTYQTDSLRSKSFTDKVNSTSSSIMDYARYNYVAQPGDGVTKLAPHIGPYDKFAIEFGYRWSGKKSARDEREFLKSILDRHQGRIYKYADAQDPRDAVDPRAQNEDLGDDPVLASKYGIKNLKEVMNNVVKWGTTGADSKDNYFETGRLLYAVINQWNNYLYHVLANVGGIYLENTVPGDGQQTYIHVEKAKQKEAVKFLLDEVLTYPEWLFNAPVYNYTFPIQSSPSGYIENAPALILKNAQAYIFWDLLNNNRLVRMIENESMNKKNAYSVVELLDQMHKHIFGMTERGVSPDLQQRLLQKGFVDALILSASDDATNKNAKKLYNEHFIFDNHTEDKMFCNHCNKLHNSRQAARTVNFYGTQANRISDAISVKRGELLRIKDLLQTRQSTPDVSAKYHYKDLILRINTALSIQ